MTSILVPVHRTLSTLGAVTGLGVFWVAELKRDPHTPFECEIGTPFFKLLLGHDTRKEVLCIWKNLRSYQHEFLNHLIVFP